MEIKVTGNNGKTFKETVFGMDDAYAKGREYESGTLIEILDDDGNDIDSFEVGAE